MYSESDLWKLASEAALDENRLMPADRVYLKTSKTVSVDEAVSSMKKRKSDAGEIIKGGLDDNSDYVRADKKYSSKQSKSSTDTRSLPEDVEDVVLRYSEKSSNADNEQRKTRGQRQTKQSRSISEDIMSVVSGLYRKITSIESRFFKEESKETTDNTKKETVSELDEFKSSSHVVTFAINGMEFSVRCLDMFIDTESGCLVISFSDRGESFFTPPVKSELRIKYDGEYVGGKLFYFGMNFSLHKLGLRFLGFLLDEHDENDEN